MKQFLLVTMIVLFALACTYPADASINSHRKMTVQTQSATLSLITVFSLPIQAFTSVSQKPVVAMGKSLTQILKQALLGSKRTHGMPLIKPHI